MKVEKKASTPKGMICSVSGRWGMGKSPSPAKMAAPAAAALI
jgi:hypothetical protein